MGTVTLRPHHRPIRCEHCRYWDNSVKHRDDDDDATGRCTVLPPRADDRDHRAVWPFTEYNDGCGAGVVDPDKLEEEEED